MGRFEEMLERTEAELAAARERVARLERRAKVLKGLDDATRELLTELLPKRGERKAATCSECGETGHRKDKCQKRKAEKAERPRGRPPKAHGDFKPAVTAERIRTTDVMRELGITPRQFDQLARAAHVKPFTLNGEPHVRREDLERLRKAVTA